MSRNGAEQPGNLMGWLIGLAAGLAVLNLALWFIWGPGPIVAVLLWYSVMADSFSALAALAIAYVAIGRYRALREPAPFWIGVGFVGFGIFALFGILAAPGLLPGDRAILSTLVNTSGWLWFLVFSSLAACLLVAVLARWPRAGAAGERWSSIVLTAGAVAAIGASLLIVRFEQYLPMLRDGAPTPLNTAWTYALLLAFAIGTVLSARRYRQTGDTIIGYVAIVQLILAFTMLTNVLGQQLYDLWFYWRRGLWVGGFVVMLFGLLSEYVGLYRREHETSLELHSLFDEMIAGFVLYEVVPDEEGRIVDIRYLEVNPAYEAMTGLRREELIGRTVREVLPDIEDYWIEALREVALTGRPTHIANYVRALNKHFDVAAYSPSRGQVAVTATDVTEQARSISALRASEERYRELARSEHRRAAELKAVLDNMVDGVFVTNAAGKVVLANEAGERLFGVADIATSNWALTEFPSLVRMRHLDGRPVFPEETASARALKGETVANVDMVIRNARTQADVYLRVSAAPIRGEAGEVTGVVVVARDVTELTELDRLKDQFIAVAAHELKTPVAIMKGYAQAFSRTPGELSEPRKRMLDAINRGADRIDRIISELLDISQLTAGRLAMRFEQIDLPQLIEEVVGRISPTAPKHHLRVARREPAIVRGDRQRIREVLTNLLDNAIKYSPDGGDVDVTCVTRCREAIVSVRDHGVGIPRGKQSRIFEPFYRAHTHTPFDYGGMGVGLYISHEIVVRHGGRMWFESEEGRGSTFSFSLPLS